MRKKRYLPLIVLGWAALMLPLGMVALSHLPAEQRFEQCSEQPEVSQCHDPLTAWMR